MAFTQWTIKALPDVLAAASTHDRAFWDEKLVPAVDLLAEHGGMLAAGQFASRRGELPFRAGGLVAALAEYLNFEQHPVLVHDARAGQVRLDLELLEAALWRVTGSVRARHPVPPSHPAIE